MHPTSRNLENFYEAMDREDEKKSSDESTIFTSLIHNIASGGKSERVVTCVFESSFSTPKTMMKYGICRIAVPISAVFDVQPKNFCGITTGNNELMNLRSKAFMQMSVLELCHLLDLHLLREQYVYQNALEPILYNLVSWNDELFDNDFGTNKL